MKSCEKSATLHPRQRFQSPSRNPLAPQIQSCLPCFLLVPVMLSIWPPLSTGSTRSPRTGRSPLESLPAPPAVLASSSRGRRSRRRDNQAGTGENIVGGCQPIGCRTQLQMTCQRPSGDGHLERPEALLEKNCHLREVVSWSLRQLPREHRGRRAFAKHRVVGGAVGAGSDLIASALSRPACSHEKIWIRAHRLCTKSPSSPAHAPGGQA